MLRKILLLTVMLATSSVCFSQLNIIPKPISVKELTGHSFAITDQTTMSCNDFVLVNCMDFLKDYLSRYYGRPKWESREFQRKEWIRLEYIKSDTGMADQYHLEVNANEILIKANSPQGVFYGIQTLIQLLPLPDKTTGKKIDPLNIFVPPVSIDDYPRFAYRGMHLDVCRHFFPVSYVKKYIDYIALHKMNYFHWHLTDDQGWRIEIKKYPKLTQTGGYRNGTIIGHYPGTANDNQPYGGFYTQEEIKDVVDYAAKRYITVVPEIEMPGHASAAIAAYPQLSCFPNAPTKMTGPVSKAGDQKSKKKVQETWGVFEDVFCPSEYTFHFLEDVMDEVMALFPSKYIHIGGDECPKEAWKKSAYCQSLEKKLGLKDEHQLQSYFIGRMEKYINSKGRKIIGWDEILEGGLAPNATVMSWRGEDGGIAAANDAHNVIMTPGSHVYFDHSQAKKDDSITIGGYTTVQKVYSYEPIPKQLNAGKEKYILGAQANMWTEYIASPAKVEYQLLPRMSALSEVLWSPKESRNEQDFDSRLLVQFKRYDLWGAHYSKAFFDPNNN